MQHPMNETAYQLDKTAFSVVSLDDPPDDAAYWFSKSPQERLAAQEYMRQVAYGYDPATVRLHRVLEIAECSWG
jgi:hypothetical protein